MRPCLIVAGSFRVTCQDAHGPWAGATIAALGGRCAERREMATPSSFEQFKREIDEELVPIAGRVAELASEYSTPQEIADELANIAARLAALEVRLEIRKAELERELNA